MTESITIFPVGAEVWFARFNGAKSSLRKDTITEISINRDSLYYYSRGGNTHPSEEVFATKEAALAYLRLQQIEEAEKTMVRLKELESK